MASAGGVMRYSPGPAWPRTARRTSDLDPLGSLQMAYVSTVLEHHSGHHALGAECIPPVVLHSFALAWRLPCQQASVHQHSAGSRVLWFARRDSTPVTSLAMQLIWS